MSKKFITLLLAGAVILGLTLFLKLSPQGDAIIGGLSAQGSFFLPLVMLAALIDSINPCAFSILLITIGFLFSMGTMRSGILKIGGAYILGIFAVYVLIGLGILNVLHLFGTPHFMAKVGASILLVIGTIDLITYFVPDFPLRPRLPSGLHGKMAGLMKNASAPAAFLLGALVGACEFPCTGGPYLMILGMLHDQGRYLSGLGYLLVYNLVFVLPLVIVLFLAADEKLFSKVQGWKSAHTADMRLYAGVLMVALGLVMFLL